MPRGGSRVGAGRKSIPSRAKLFIIRAYEGELAKELEKAFRIKEARLAKKFHLDLEQFKKDRLAIRNFGIVHIGGKRLANTSLRRETRKLDDLFRETGGKKGKRFELLENMQFHFEPPTGKIKGLPRLISVKETNQMRSRLQRAIATEASRRFNLDINQLMVQRILREWREV